MMQRMKAELRCEKCSYLLSPCQVQVTSWVTQNSRIPAGFFLFCGDNEASSIFQLDSTLLQDVLFERSKIYIFK